MILLFKISGIEVFEKPRNTNTPGFCLVKKIQMLKLDCRSFSVLMEVPYCYEEIYRIVCAYLYTHCEKYENIQLALHVQKDHGLVGIKCFHILKKFII